MTTVVDALRALDEWVLSRLAGARRGRHRVRRKTSRSVVLGVGILVGMVGFGGLAAAAWSSSGTGSGTARAGSVSLSASMSPVSGLYPGATVGVSVTITNTSAEGGVVVTALQGSTAAVQTQGKAAGCVAAGVVTFAGGALPGTVIVAGGSQTLAGSVSMGAGALDACQGATFSVPVTVTGRAG